MAGQGTKKSILIVDDEPDIIMVVKMALQQNGWVVSDYANPVLALQHFEQNSTKYDAILSDIRMPFMSGFDLVRKVKSINPQIRIFLMTSLGISRSELQKVLTSVRVDGLIEKPMTMRMLVSLIEKGMMVTKRRYHSFEVDNEDIAALDYG